MQDAREEGVSFIEKCQMDKPNLKRAYAMPGESA